MTEIAMSPGKSVRRRWNTFVAAAVLLMLACSSGWQTGLAAEDEEPSAPTSTTPATERDEQDAKEKESEKPLDDPRDEDLLQSLNVDGMEDEDVADIDQLDRAIQAMRDAQQRMEADEAGGETLNLQRQAIRDLTALIEKIKNPPQNSQDDDQQNQDQNQDQDKNKDKSKSKGKKSKGRNIRRLVKSEKGSGSPENNGEQKKGQDQAQQPGSNSDNAKDSSENVDPKKAAEAEAARQRQLVKDVWGHLPPALREELLNVYSEKYLPRYEDLVRRYYEALAEKQKNRGR